MHIQEPIVSMNKELPSDLRQSELQLFESTLNCLNNKKEQYFSINLKFEGLKIEGVVIRTFKHFVRSNMECLLAFPDFGSSALHKRDHPEISNYISTFKELVENTELISSDKILLAVNPQPYDYDLFVELCTKYKNNRIIMFNGKLEDTAVGIGLVARDRRSNFIKQWTTAYYLQPLYKGAIMYTYDHKWQLYSESQDGYRFLVSFDRKPDDLLISEYLA